MKAQRESFEERRKALRRDKKLKWKLKEKALRRGGKLLLTEGEEAGYDGVGDEVDGVACAGEVQPPLVLIHGLHLSLGLKKQKNE